MLNSLIPCLGMLTLTGTSLCAAEIRSALPPQHSDTLNVDTSRTFEQPSDRATGQDAGEPRTVRTGDGFLFVDGVYVPSSQSTTWANGVLRLQNPPSQRSSLAGQFPSVSGGYAALLCYVPSPSSSRLVSVPERELNRVIETLNAGDIAIVSPEQEIWCLPISSGGYELLSGLSVPPGAERDRHLKAMEDAAPHHLSDPTRTWLTSYEPPGSFLEKASARLSLINTLEQQNVAAISAFQRFETWNYPMTVLGMVTVVAAMGSLISVRPFEIVGDAASPEDVTVRRFLWLIAGMSVIDLVWTLLAHQANRVAEVNPLGSVIVDDVLRVIVFKVLATSLAIGILFRLRHSLIARKACWWACLTLALLTARWVVVSGVTG